MQIILSDQVWTLSYSEHLFLSNIGIHPPRAQQNAKAMSNNLAALSLTECQLTFKPILLAIFHHSPPFLGNSVKDRTIFLGNHLKFLWPSGRLFILPPVASVLAALAEMKENEISTPIYSSLISQIGAFAFLVPLSKTMKQVTTGVVEPSVAPKSPTAHNCPAVNSMQLLIAGILPEFLWLGISFFLCIAQSGLKC